MYYIYKLFKLILHSFFNIHFNLVIKTQLALCFFLSFWAFFMFRSLAKNFSFIFLFFSANIYKLIIFLSSVSYITYLEIMAHLHNQDHL